MQQLKYAVEEKEEKEKEEMSFAVTRRIGRRACWKRKYYDDGCFL
jgi:hypothetical protein